LNADETARELLLAASRFAAAAITKFRTEIPNQLEALAGASAKFGVRVDDILSRTPRVTLIAIHNGEEIDIAHVDLEKVAGPGAIQH
jgi:hypothetical protein